MRSAAVPGTDGGIAGGDAARAGSTGLIGAVQAARNAARRYDVPEAAGRSLGQYPDDAPHRQVPKAPARMDFIPSWTIRETGPKPVRHEQGFYLSRNHSAYNAGTNSRVITVPTATPPMRT